MGGDFTPLVLERSKPVSGFKYLLFLLPMFSSLFSSGRSNSTAIKTSLFIVLFFIVAGIAGLYFYERFSSVKKIAKEIKIDSDASLVLNSMHHTSTRNGLKAWTIDAASAKVLKNEAKAILTDISVQFFLKNGGQIDAKAEEGYIDTKDNNMELSNNVLVSYGSTLLATDQLHYDKKSHIIFSNRPVTVISSNSVDALSSIKSNELNGDSSFIRNFDGSFIKSDSMKIDLNKNTLELTGNIYAILSDDLDFSTNTQ